MRMTSHWITSVVSWCRLTQNRKREVWQMMMCQQPSRTSSSLGIASSTNLVTLPSPWLIIRRWIVSASSGRNINNSSLHPRLVQEPNFNKQCWFTAYIAGWIPSKWISITCMYYYCDTLIAQFIEHEISNLSIIKTVCLKFFIRISTCTKYKIKYFMNPPLPST